MTRQKGSEEEVHEEHDAPRGPKPPLGTWAAPLSEVARPQGRLVVPACQCGGVLALVSVVMVQEAAHDDATISNLLLQTLLAELEAKEVEELEAKLAGKEQWLMTHIEQLRGRPDLHDELDELSRDRCRRLVHDQAAACLYWLRRRERQWTPSLRFLVQRMLHLAADLVSVFGDIWNNSIHFLRPSHCTRQVCLQHRSHEVFPCLPLVSAPKVVQRRHHARFGCLG